MLPVGEGPPALAIKAPYATLGKVDFVGERFVRFRGEDLLVLAF